MYVTRWEVRGRLGDDRPTLEQIGKALPTGWIAGQRDEVEATGRRMAEVASKAKGLDPETWPESLRFEPVGMDPVDFRQIVRDRAAEVGVNTYQLGLMAGISPRTLAYWVKGSSDEIGDKKLAAVIAALGIKVK